MSTTDKTAAEGRGGLWAEGDYHLIGLRFLPVSERLAEDLDVRPGERVLDVAGGTGNTALAAARRDAEVICSDYEPRLLEHAARRSEVEGLPFEAEYADAQALPYADGRFDVVTSTFGVMFAPAQETAAAELLRVLRPGGRIGLANWTPDGAMGNIFALVEKYAPETGIQAPVRWGTEDGMTDLLGDAVASLDLRRRTFDITAVSYDAVLDRYRNWFPPVRGTLERLDEAGREAFVQDWRRLWERFNRAEDGTVVATHEYLQVIAVKPPA